MIAAAQELPNGATLPGGRPSRAKHLDVRRCLPGGLLLALLVLGPAAMADTYEAIDCPDSFGTDARGINDRGDVVGICEDADGVYGFRLRRASSR